MPNVPNTQGGTKAPAIPSMDVTPPPPATALGIGKQVKGIVSQAVAAAKDAKKTAQDAAKTGQDAGHIATTAPPSPGYNPNDVIPPGAVDMTYAFFFTVAFCVVGFPLARAISRRIDRKTEIKTVAAPDVTPHIRQLQDSVDAMAIELERISEGQRFTAKLLAERSERASQ
jgi:hypothetical protein